MRNIDFGLSIRKSDINITTGDSLAIRIGVEDVANSGTVSEWGVRYSDLLLVVGIGGGYKEFTSGEGVEVVSNVLFLDGMLPNFLGLSSLVDLGGHFVNVRVGVHILPQRLSVLRIVATSVGLLRSIVVEGDSSESQSEGESGLQLGLIVIGVHESCIVMVINEDA